MDLHSVLTALVFHYPFIRGSIECDFQVWSCLAAGYDSAMAPFQENRRSCCQFSLKMNLKQAELETRGSNGLLCCPRFSASLPPCGTLNRGNKADLGTERASDRPGAMILSSPHNDLHRPECDINGRQNAAVLQCQLRDYVGRTGKTQTTCVERHVVEGRIVNLRVEIAPHVAPPRMVLLGLTSPLRLHLNGRIRRHADFASRAAPPTARETR
jgi:hypothetical protein